MNEYTLSYTGAQVDEILTKAQTDVSTQEDQPLSPEAQQIVRNNINAATKDIEPTVAQLQSEIVSINTDITNLNSNIEEVNEHLTLLDEVRNTDIPHIESVLDTLEYTQEEYLYLASALADDFSPAIIYDKGDFVHYSGNIYERKEDAEVPGYWKANEWTYIGKDSGKIVYDLGLIRRPFVTEKNQGNPYTENGLTFTVTQYNTVVINGSIPPNTTISYTLLEDAALLLESNKTYKLTGCPTITNNNYISMRADIYFDNTFYRTFNDYGRGVTFTGEQIIGPSTTQYYPVITICAKNETDSAITCDNLVFIPNFIKY